MASSEIFQYQKFEPRNKSNGFHWKTSLKYVNIHEALLKIIKLMNMKNEKIKQLQHGLKILSDHQKTEWRSKQKIFEYNSLFQTYCYYRNLRRKTQTCSSWEIWIWKLRKINTLSVFSHFRNIKCPNHGAIGMVFCRLRLFLKFWAFHWDFDRKIEDSKKPGRSLFEFFLRYIDSENFYATNQRSVFQSNACLQLDSFQLKSR